MKIPPCRPYTRHNTTLSSEEAKTPLLPKSPLLQRSTPKNKDFVLPIYDITPFTLLDFPDHMACILWFCGCNMRCGYCHNPQIVRAGAGRVCLTRVEEFLKKRQGLLDAVVLSGGEATLYPDLIPLIKQIKAMGYAVKLDTNGTRPALIQTLLDQDLLDYIALDYKAPEHKFYATTKNRYFEAFSQTLDLLCARIPDSLKGEIRTTIHTTLLNEQDVKAIIDDLSQRGYRGVYYIQNYQDDNNRPTLNNLSPQKHPFAIDSIKAPKGFQIAFRNF